MPDKPRHASQYRSGQAALVRRTCLYLATKLGDLMDEVVVVGGTVPSLLVDQARLPEGVPAHAGTIDLDIGLELGLLAGGRYHALASRLRSAGFSPDKNERGRPTRQRWRAGDGTSATVDFLIPPTSTNRKAARIQNVEKDFAAVITPGLELAFRDRRLIRIKGMTTRGEKADCEIGVCGPGAYVVLKALAFAGRGENKDAYDLFYIVRNCGAGVDEVAASLRPLMPDKDAMRAVEVLKKSFLDIDGTGPRRVAEFVSEGPDEALQADVVSHIRHLLELLH